MKFVLNQFTLYRGQDEQFVVALIDDDGMPVNISGATAISLLLKKADNTLLEKVPYTGMAVGVTSQIWFYAFNLSRAESSDLLVGPKQSIEFKITMGTGAIRYLVMKNCLAVLDFPF